MCFAAALHHWSGTKQPAPTGGSSSTCLAVCCQCWSQQVGCEWPQHELHEWCLAMVGWDCWHGSQKGTKRQRKPFSDARLPYSNLSYVQCFSASQSPFLGTPFLGTIFFWDWVFFNKRRKPPSLVPLPSFHGFNGLKWLIQHHCGHQSLPKCFLVLLWHFPDLKS